MWLLFGFISAFLLGCYDICKKTSVDGNAVLPVLLTSMVCSTLLQIPLAITQIPELDAHTHLLIFIKACLIMSFGLTTYFGIRRVPLTIASPIGATGPMWVVMGAVMLFGEHLEWHQWIAIAVTLLSFMAFSMIGKKEGFSFRNPYVWLVIAGTLIGACSGLYDKYALQGLNINRYAFQFFYASEQALMMLIFVLIFWWPKRHEGIRFKWRWSILGISLFWVTSELTYFYALSQPDAMLSMLSVIRRTGVIIPFIYGTIVLHDKNTRLKAVALTGVLIGVTALALL